MNSNKHLPTMTLRHGVSAEILQDRSFSEVLDASIEVHRALGPGHAAQTYKNAIYVELSQRGRIVYREPTFSVMYKKQVVGAYIADLLVDERILIKVIAEPSMDTAHKSDTMRGITAGNIKVGVLFNFALVDLFFARIL